MQSLLLSSSLRTPPQRNNISHSDDAAPMYIGAVFVLLANSNLIAPSNYRLQLSLFAQRFAFRTFIGNSILCFCNFGYLKLLFGNLIFRLIIVIVLLVF